MPFINRWGKALLIEMEDLKRLINKYFPDYDDWLDTKVTLEPVWMATIGLGDKEWEVIDDDGRPGFEEKSWTRLKCLVENSDLELRRFYIRWRRNKILVEENKPCFFFARCLEGDWGTKQNFNFFLTGGGFDSILVRKWHLPTLKEDSSEIRSFSDVKPEFLIWNTCMTQDIPIQK